MSKPRMFTSQSLSSLPIVVPATPTSESALRTSTPTRFV